MPDVLILVGSESDKPRIEPAFDVLSKAGVSYEFHVSSAHRQPEQTAKLVSGARGQGFKVVIAGAGLSAALAGFAARSEEHTSELQSLTNLVCRLLLEKKNKNVTRTY